MCATLLALVTVTACGPGVVTPKDHRGAPLFTLSADVAGALTSVPSDDVRGALVWSRYQPALVDCLAAVPAFEAPLDFDDPADQATARALSVCLTLHLSGQVESDGVQLAPVFPSSFDIPIFNLPQDDVLTVSDGARMGLAAVDVYIDGNNNNTLDLVPAGTAFADDTVIGTSVAIREEDNKHVLVVYREGDVSPVWKLFQGLYDCPATPPEGFSVVTVEVDPAAGTIACAVSAGPVSVVLDESDLMRREICEPNPSNSQFIKPESDDAVPGGAAIECDGGTAYFSAQPDAVCPLVSHFDLVGCTDTSSEQSCNASFFDLTDSPPSWWPCGGGLNVFVSNDDAELATAGLDTLGTLYFHGSWMFELSALSIQAQVDGEGSTATLTSDAFVLHDNDGNGWVTAGDSITIIESADIYNASSGPGYFTLEALVDGVVVGQGGYVPLEIPNVTPPLHTIAVLDAPGAVAIDALAFSITSVQGEGNYALSQLSVQVYVYGEFPVLFPSDALTLVDNDGDGRFGEGDTLDVTEFDHPFTIDDNGNSPVSILVRTGVNTAVPISTGYVLWNRYTATVAEAPLAPTDGLDTLAVITVTNATPTAFVDVLLYAQIYRDGTSRQLEPSALALDLLDNDGDGLVSRGDILTVRELVDVVSASDSGSYAYINIDFSDGSARVDFDLP